MRAIGAKTARDLRPKQLFQQRLEPRLLLRLVAVAAEGFAALDRVGDVLGHVAHFGECRPVASAGDMRVDEPGRDQAKEVEAPLFVMRRLMGGPLLSNRRLCLSQGGVALGELRPESFRISAAWRRSSI